MKTIIAPAYLHEYLKIEKLKENNSTYLLDHRFIDPDSFIKDIIGQDNDSLLSVNTVFNLLELNIFKEVIRYPSFKTKVFNFYRFLRKNDISLDTLPEDNETNKELKKILLSLKNIDIKEKNYPQLYNTLENMDFSDYEVYQSYTNIDNQKFYDLLFHNGAVKKEMSITDNEYKVYKCLNKHQECEAVAQDIINRELNIEDVNIVLCSSEYNKVINQVFNIYKLPFGIIEDKKINNCNQRFISLLNLYLDQSVENYQNAVSINAFSVISNRELDYYLDNFILDFNECKTEFTYFSSLDSKLDKRSIESLIKIEDYANQVHKTIIPELNQLINSKDIENALTVIFNILKKNNDLGELKKLKRTIEDSIEYLNEDNVDIFISTIKTYSSYSTSFINRIAVTNLLKPVPSRKTTYVLGCDQKSYPAFNLANGYFDQDYLDKINYYSQSEQYNYHLDQIHWIYRSAETVNFYSSIAGYDGKAKSMAFEIENLAKAEFINIDSKNYNQNVNHQLNPESARKAFIKNNNIYGSVSSYEKYFSCPYAYFLNYGLKLYPPQIPELAANTIGTATHSIFETLVKQDPESYGEADLSTISNVTADYFSELKKIFRRKTNEIDSVQNRLVNTIFKSFEFYKSMEEHTLFKASYFEKEIRSAYSKNNITLNIKGYIDRVDLYSDGFRIIDYKSGHQTLNEKSLLKGSKLQLATYTDVISEQLQLVPYGSYYAYFKAKKINIPAFTFSTKKKTEVYDAQKKHDEFISLFKLNGFTYKYDDNCDNSQHISGINPIGNTTKSNTIRGKAIIFDQVHKALEDIYDHLIMQLSSGNIELKPVEKACDYCEYLPICRFKGMHIKYPPLISEVDLKSSGDEE